MSNPTYQLYVSDCIGLANSLTVKSEATAHSMNKTMSDYGYAVDLNTPITWKYYVNLGGEYHPADKPMYVLSTDTQEKILFSTEVLKRHPNTRFLYTHNSEETRLLTEQYPDQWLLIRGIIDPVEPNVAIAADDHEILSFNNQYIEPQEESLVSSIQHHINFITERWFMNDFKNTDPLYSASLLGILSLSIYDHIINHRVAMCKSNEAHTYHIWEYLGSHGYLDKYRNSVNLKQALWLYRNIQWIYDNKGKTETFDSLVKHLFSDLNIRLFTYDLVLDSKYINQDKKPSITVDRVSINLPENSGSMMPTSVDEISLKLRKSVGADNSWIKEEVDGVIATCERGQTSKYATKVIEALVEYPKPISEISTIDFQMRHWVKFAAEGTYTTYIYINEPKTGAQIRVNPLEAYILNMYLFSLWMERPLHVIPPLRVGRVIKNTLPTEEELMGLTTKRGVTKEVAEWIIEQIPKITSMISMNEFNKYVHDLVDSCRRIKYLKEIQESDPCQIAIEFMYEALFEDRVYNTGMSMDEFISSIGVDFSVLRPMEARELSMTIIQAATGIRLGSNGSAGEMQAAMISIMKQVSSYNINFITNFSDLSPIAAKRATIRFMDMEKTIVRGTEFCEGGYRYDEVSKLINKDSILTLNNMTDTDVVHTVVHHIAVPGKTNLTPNRPTQVIRFESPRVSIKVRNKNNVEK